MNCPHCGAEERGDGEHFHCWTWIKDTNDQGYDCLQRQISALKAELAEHKTALNLCQMALTANRWYDVRRLKAEALEAIEQIIKDLKATQ